MTEYALRLENSTDTRERMRKGDTLNLVPGPVSGARNGLRADGGGVVTAVAGTMTVEVTPFTAWVDGGASDAQGGYPFVLDATKTLTITDGDAALSRTDTVVAEVKDNTHDASGSTTATVRVLPGTPGGGVPTLPTSCVPLRNIIVPAGTSAGTGGLSGSNLSTDRRAYTAGLGGVVPVSGTTERDAMGARKGQPVFRLDTLTLEVFNGTSWDAFKKDDGMVTRRGTKSLTTDGTSTIGSTVTFAAPYSGVPTVVASVSNAQQQFYGQAYNVTATGCEVRAVQRDGTGTSGVGVEVSWIASGPA